MRKAKGFGPRPHRTSFQVSILESPAPGVHTVAVSCPAGRFVVTATPAGVALSNAQLAQISPGTLRWLAKNRDAIGQRLYASSEVQA